MRWMRGAAVRQFLVSFAAGITAMGLVNLLRWVREPAVHRTASDT